MQRILIIICLCLTASSLSGCGVFCPPRHEVLVVEQSYSGQTGQTGQGTSEEIPLVSTPDPETVANTFTTTTVVKSYTPRTYVAVGYPAFYTGWYPFWGYRPFLSFGYYHHPYRRHHYHHRPPHHGGHGGHGPHGGPHHRR